MSYYLRIGLVSLTLALATLALLIFGPRTTPLRLVATTPSGQEAPTGAALRVTFSRAVDRQSAEASFRLTPAAAGRFFWEDRTLTFQPERPLAAATDYQVRFADGLRDEAGRPLAAELGWSFRTRSPRLLALRATPEGGSQLWLVGTDGSGARRLLDAPEGISELAVAPGGAVAAYVALREAGRAALLLLDLETGATTTLFDDASASVAAPAWAPESDLLAFERRALLEGQFGAPQIWLAQPDGTLLGPLVGDADAPVAYAPVWSPDAGRVAFIDGASQALTVYSFFSDQLRELPARSAAAPVWLPDGLGLVFSGSPAAGPAEPPRLHLVTLGEAPLSRALSDGTAPELHPALDPDGAAVAFTRSEPDGSNGRIWLVSALGGASRPLSAAGEHMDTQPVWAPDGRLLAFIRASALGPPTSQAVVIEPASGAETVVLNDVVQVVWAP
jgi:Tol biopolymer transport system component